MKKEIICTVCPVGCRVTVEGEGAEIVSISGNTCKRGETYAKDEFIAPKRILTCSVRLEGASRAMLPVRSSQPLPKEKIMECMEVIRQVTVAAPITEGQVIISNILGTGIDMVSSMSI